MKTVFEALSPQYERSTGYRLAIGYGPSSQLETRLADGEQADLAILTRSGAKDMIARGKIRSGSLVDVARSSLGVAVAKGVPKPDISSVEGFRQALLAAQSVAVSKPVGAGQSGVHMAKIFAELGIAEQMQAKAIYGAGGASGLVGLIILRGEAEIGVQQLAELMGVTGIDVVGPLPPEIQSITAFTAGIPTGAKHAEPARALIDFLTTPAAGRVLAAKGLEPM